MDRICENKTRLVEMKGELLVIMLVPCGTCERCMPKQVEVVDLAESDSDSDIEAAKETQKHRGNRKCPRYGRGAKRLAHQRARASR